MCVPFTLFTVRMGWAQAKVCSGIPTVFSEASPLCALKLAAQCTLGDFKADFLPRTIRNGGTIFLCPKKSSIVWCHYDYLTAPVRDRTIIRLKIG